METYLLRIDEPPGPGWGLPAYSRALYRAQQPGHAGGRPMNEDEYLETMRQAGLRDAQVVARQTYDVTCVRSMIDETASSVSLHPNW